MIESTLPLPGLSPVSDKTIVARFDGGRLSSDGGLLVLREVERRLGVADRLAACIDDPRDPDLITHSLSDIIRFRMLMIAAGYEDGNDADNLRIDPMFKMAMDQLPSGGDLCDEIQQTAGAEQGRPMPDVAFRPPQARNVLRLKNESRVIHRTAIVSIINHHFLMG